METLNNLIFWTTRSKRDLAKILSFNTDLFNLKKAKEIAYKIEDCTKVLIRFPKIGAIDNEFLHLKINYRKIFQHHCKITYRVGKNKIFIIRVFDMRQHPNKNR